MLWLGDEAGRATKLDLPTDVGMEAHRDWLAVKLRNAWTVGAGPMRPTPCSASRCRPSWPATRNFTDRVRAGAAAGAAGLLLDRRQARACRSSTNCGPVFEVCTPSASGWTRANLPGLPEIGVVDVWRLDADEAESNGDLLANVQDPLTPPSLMLIEGIASPAV